MMRVETISDVAALQKRCIEVIHHFVDLGNQKLGINLPYPKVKFDIKGTNGGTACSATNTIRLNPTLLRMNGESYVMDTPPHEVAHLLCDRKYGAASDVHGPKWRSVMWALGLKATRCHSFDVSTVPTRIGKVRRKIELDPIHVDGTIVATPRGGVKIVTFED